MIRRIRDLLYDQGFTISGARNKMQEVIQSDRAQHPYYSNVVDGLEVFDTSESRLVDLKSSLINTIPVWPDDRWMVIHRELCEIRNLLSLAV